MAPHGPDQGPPRALRNLPTVRPSTRAEGREAQSRSIIDTALVKVRFFNRAWRSSSSLSFRVVSSCAGHASFRGRRSGESRSCHKHWSDRVGVPCFQTRYDAQQTSAALPRLPRPHRTNCNESWSSCQAIKSSGKHLLLDAAEHGSIGPHGVEHDGKFAGHGDQRAFASFLAGQPGTEAAQR